MFVHVLAAPVRPLGLVVPVVPVVTHCHPLTSVDTRWHHPVQGMLPPARFMKAAEDLQVLSKIDGMILEQAVADMTSWRKRGIIIPSVSVNVSFNRLADEHLICALKKLDFTWLGTLKMDLNRFLSKFDFSKNRQAYAKTFPRTVEPAHPKGLDMDKGHLLNKRDLV